MNSGRRKYESVNQYIKAFPKEIQDTLEKIRGTIQKAAPEAKETISYQIPTFKLHGNLVHFAAFKNHIGFYPASKAIEVFKKELSEYELSKGTIRFSLDKPIPLSLISKITKFRVKENLERKKRKTK